MRPIFYFITSLITDWFCLYPQTSGGHPIVDFIVMEEQGIASPSMAAGGEASTAMGKRKRGNPGSDCDLLGATAATAAVLSRRTRRGGGGSGGNGGGWGGAAGGAPSDSDARWQHSVRNLERAARRLRIPLVTREWVYRTVMEGALPLGSLAHPTAEGAARGPAAPSPPAATPLPTPATAAVGKEGLAGIEPPSRVNGKEGGKRPIEVGDPPSHNEFSFHVLPPADEDGSGGDDGGGGDLMDGPSGGSLRAALGCGHLSGGGRSDGTGAQVGCRQQGGKRSVGDPSPLNTPKPSGQMASALVLAPPPTVAWVEDDEARPSIGRRSPVQRPPMHPGGGPSSFGPHRLPRAAFIVHVPPSPSDRNADRGGRDAIIRVHDCVELVCHSSPPKCTSSLAAMCLPYPSKHSPAATPCPAGSVQLFLPVIP